MIRKVTRRSQNQGPTGVRVDMNESPRTYEAARAQYHQLLKVELKATSKDLKHPQSLAAAQRHSNRTNKAIRLMNALEVVEATPVISNVRTDGNITNHGARADGRTVCGAPIHEDQGASEQRLNCGRCHSILVKRALKAAA